MTGLADSNPDKRPKASLVRNPTGRLARFAHTHDHCRRWMRRLRIIPNLIGPFYRSGA